MDPMGRIERRLAEIDRGLRRVAAVIGPVGPAAILASGASDDLGGPQTDILLERVGRVTEALETMPRGDAGELLVMRSLLSDVSLVTAAFRGRAALVARHLDTAAEELGVVRRAVGAARGRDRTGGS